MSFAPRTALASVEADDRVDVFANGTRQEFDLLATIPRHKAPAVLVESGLLSESGWVEVDRATLGTSFPDVYA